jgi:hypothetical protein
MKKTVITIALALMLAATAWLSGCTVGSSMNGSGKIATKDIDVTNFSSVEVEGAFLVEIQQSDNFGVSITTDDNLIGRVLVTREEKALKLSIQAAATFFPTSLKAKISMPHLYGLRLSKGAKVGIGSFKSTYNFDLFMTDGSEVDGFMDCGNVNFDLTKGSRANLKGAGLAMNLYGSGASKVNLSEFVVNSAVVNFSGGSESSINIKDKFDVILSGGSRLYYLGNPVINNASITDGSYIQHQ